MAPRRSIPQGAKLLTIGEIYQLHREGATLWLMAGEGFGTLGWMSAAAFLDASAPGSASLRSAPSGMVVVGFVGEEPPSAV